MTRSFDIFFDVRLKNGWVNNKDADDVKCHTTDYDVTEMHRFKIDAASPITKWIICH